MVPPDPAQPYVGPAPDFYPKLPIALRWGLAFIWQASNDGHQQDSAPGETFRTSWGITQSTWNAAVEHGTVTGDLTDATQEQCAAIYQAQYWNVMMLNEMPIAVAFVMFCDGTLTGTGHEVRLLQRILGVAQDGVVGRRYTLPALHNYAAIQTTQDLADALINADIAYLSTLANALKFIHGWTRRTSLCRIWMHQLAGIPKAPPL